MAKFYNKNIINNKAKSLLFLKKKKFNIPELAIFNCKSFFDSEERILKKIQYKFKDKIAIRSSAKNEDGSKYSNAGKYLSYVNVNPNNKEKLRKKILSVIKAYKDNNNIFFVQSMVKNIKFSGVVLTRDLNNYDPYFVINYSVGSNSTLVTSGEGKSESIKYLPNNVYSIDKKFKSLVQIVLKLKNLFKCELDVEFCIDNKGKVFIVQTRNLNIPKKYQKNLVDIKTFSYHLEKLSKKIKKLKKTQNTELGKTTFFGVMPDWNPAEIIGKKPKPLALSIYRELITDHVWSENRFKYGFKDISQFHLMTTFYNTPFIDVKIDFNSWLPRNLKKETQSKLINYYLNKFKRNKNYHDKIEKEIIYTCYSFNIEKKIKRSLKNVLNKKEIYSLIRNLKKINNLALNEKKEELIKINSLIKKQKNIEASNLYYFDKIYWHVENCKKYGTLPFAGLARCGFIAIEILDSFVENKILTILEKNKFLSTINSISSEILTNFKKLDKKKFLALYGHLRPNSYEITSLNYRDGYDLYFKNNIPQTIKKEKFKFSIQQQKKIVDFIKKFNLSLSFNEFLSFLKDSIESREYSKFIFMKSVDLIFENLKQFGKKYKISLEDLSFLKINDVTDFYYNLNSGETVKVLKNMIAQNKKEYFKNYNINLPDTITDTKDLYLIHLSKNSPNYITSNECQGDIVELKMNKKININHKIVCIENADPGFDFIFSQKINALITKYGGFNSHMSIRCSELNIPAIVGVGEENYNKIIKSKKININCNLKKFVIL